jgi:hypothetical protein
MLNGVVVLHECIQCCAEDLLWDDVRANTPRKHH